MTENTQMLFSVLGSPVLIIPYTFGHLLSICTVWRRCWLCAPLGQVFFSFLLFNFSNSFLGNFHSFPARLVHWQCLTAAICCHRPHPPPHFFQWQRKYSSEHSGYFMISYSSSNLSREGIAHSIVYRLTSLAGPVYFSTELRHSGPFKKLRSLSGEANHKNLFGLNWMSEQPVSWVDQHWTCTHAAFFFPFEAYNAAILRQMTETFNFFSFSQTNSEFKRFPNFWGKLGPDFYLLFP